MTEESQRWIEELINGMPVDIRAEVIIADLEEMGLDQDDTVIAAEGLGKRSFSNDMLRAKWMENKSGNELLYVYLSREGIYDALPEGLFHQPASKKPFRGTREMIEMVKKGKQEENEARLFFAPYEQEFFRQRIETEKQERKTLSQLRAHSGHDLFAEFWQLSNRLSPRQLSVMLNLLPLAHMISGDFDFAAQCFENVLKTRVSITETCPVERKMPAGMQKTLGRFTLGVDMVTGNTFNDGDPAVEIRIGPVASSQVRDFIPGGKSLEIIDILISYFIPVETDVVTSVTVDPQSFGFTLGKSPETNRLGFNTSLKKSKLNANIA